MATGISVHFYVCMSHTGIESKLITIGTCSFYHWVVQGFKFLVLIFMFHLPGELHCNDFKKFKWNRGG